MQLDKFYTSAEAASVFRAFIDKHLSISDYPTIVEPSAGGGALLEVLTDHPDVKALDLMPDAPGIEQGDFLDYRGPSGSLVIGNPPFGNRSSLAVAFFNHAAKWADAIAFIVPVTWERYGIHRQLSEGWALVAQERLPEKSFEVGGTTPGTGKPYQVRCVMQVWIKGDSPGLRLTSRPSGDNPWFDFVRRGDECDFAIRQSYPKTLNNSEIVPTQSMYFIKAKVPGVREVFDRVEWQAYENRHLIGGASVPCLDKASVVKFYEKYKG